MNEGNPSRSGCDSQAIWQKATRFAFRRIEEDKRINIMYGSVRSAKQAYPAYAVPDLRNPVIHRPLQADHLRQRTE
jgi:hypothetical protein